MRKKREAEYAMMRNGLSGTCLALGIFCLAIAGARGETKNAAAGTKAAQENAATPENKNAPPGVSMNASTPRIGFVALRVLDVTKSLDFYTRVLGMKELGRVNPGGAIHEVLVGWGGSPDAAEVILVYDDGRTKPYEHGDAYSRTGVWIADMDATMKKLNDSGVKIVHPPTRVENLHLIWAEITDPEGNMLEVLQRI
jgi:lactoylglutathione lyase